MAPPYPLTETGCVFPYVNTSATGPCSIVCADHLGSSYYIFRDITLAVTTIASIAFLIRMVFIAQRVMNDKTGSKGLRKTLEYWFYVGVTFTLLMVA